MRYEHLGWNNLARLQKEAMVKGLKLHASAFTDENSHLAQIYEKCMLANQQEDPFYSQTAQLQEC
jgi:hypothetical protein